MSAQDKSEKESFNLIDAASDLFGGLVAGVTVASASHDVSGLLAAPVGVGVAHTLRFAARFFANRAGCLNSVANGRELGGNKISRPCAGTSVVVTSVLVTSQVCAKAVWVACVSNIVG